MSVSQLGRKKINQIALATGLDVEHAYTWCRRHKDGLYWWIFICMDGTIGGYSPETGKVQITGHDPSRVWANYVNGRRVLTWT